MLEVETACIATIDRLSPHGSRYREAIQQSIENWKTAHTQVTREVSGILRALRMDYEAGYLRTLEELRSITSGWPRSSVRKRSAKPEKRSSSVVDELDTE